MNVDESGKNLHSSLCQTSQYLTPRGSLHGNCLSPEGPILYPTANSCPFYKEFFFLFWGAGNTAVPQVQGPLWNFSLSNLEIKWKIDFFKKRAEEFSLLCLILFPQNLIFQKFPSQYIIIIFSSQRVKCFE